jgi:hypothetical protein
LLAKLTFLNSTSTKVLLSQFNFSNNRAWI